MNVQISQNKLWKTSTIFIKSVLDRVVAAIALIALSPLILGVAIAVYFRMGHPIIFTQPRPGKDCRVFTFYKFRTMLNQRNSDGNLLCDAQRLTPFGKFLRESSLDELPQLWNILKGDMSFVGCRPLMVKYLDLYTPEQLRRHEMKPGLTGLAQVTGRNAITWKEKFQLDVWYVDNWSLWLDLKILFLTVWKVIRKEGVSQANHVTMEEFRGN